MAVIAVLYFRLKLTLVLRLAGMDDLKKNVFMLYGTKTDTSIQYNVDPEVITNTHMSLKLVELVTKLVSDCSKAKESRTYYQVDKSARTIPT